MTLKTGEIRTVWDENMERTVVLRERDSIEYILTISTNGALRFHEYAAWKRESCYYFYTTVYRVFDDTWKKHACDAIRTAARPLIATLRSKRLAGQRFP